MKKIVLRVLLLLTMFAVVAGGIYYTQNYNAGAEVKKERETTLPVVYMTYHEDMVNCLYGYAGQMDASYVRDTITPLSETRRLNIKIVPHENYLTGIYYEVRTLDKERLLEKTSVNTWNERNGYIEAELPIENLIQEGEEYLLIIRLSTEAGTDINYYTRIVQGTANLEEKLEFVKNFSEKTFDKAAAEELVPYLESGSRGDNTNFGAVNIYSSFSQITWGDLEPRRLTEPIAAIKEIQGDITGISLTYLVGAKNMYGTEETYLVQEYFRTRYTPTRTYLLNYDRDMEQFFEPARENIHGSRINLGITKDASVEMKASPDGMNTCMVVNGEVWGYQSAGNQLTCLYGGYSLEALEAWSQHDAKVIRVEDSGDIYFAVYGYLKGTVHEGEVGISFKHYKSKDGQVEELLYIPYQKSYGCLKESLGGLFTLTENNNIFFMLEGNIYAVDLMSREYMLAVSGLKEENYVINENGNIVAWQNGEHWYEASEINILLLEENREFTITSKDGSYLRVIGFIGDDLVYGTAGTEDVFRNVNGSIEYYMSKLAIVGRDEQQAGSYGRTGYYFTKADITENMIILYQYEKTEDGYKPAKEEYITNNSAEDTKKLTATFLATELKKKELGVNLITAAGSGNLLTKYAEEEIPLEDKTLWVKELPDTYFRYYVYAKGQVYSADDVLAEAIQTADNSYGVVIDASGDYIWRRARQNTAKTLSGISVYEPERNTLFSCVDAMLKYAGAVSNSQELYEAGETTLSIINAATEGGGLDLTGCSMKQVLNFIDTGQPILAKLQEDYVLLVGYDSYNAIVLNPRTGNNSKIGLEDGTSLFAKSGNQFITYQDK